MLAFRTAAGEYISADVTRAENNLMICYLALQLYFLWLFSFFVLLAIFLAHAIVSRLITHLRIPFGYVKLSRSETDHMLEPVVSILEDYRIRGSLKVYVARDVMSVRAFVRPIFFWHAIFLSAPVEVLILKRSPVGLAILLHELGHVVHRDYRYFVFRFLIVAAIPISLFNLLFKNDADLVNAAIGLVPIVIAYSIYTWCLRRREYLADAFAVNYGASLEAYLKLLERQTLQEYRFRPTPKQRAEGLTRFSTLTMKRDAYPLFRIVLIVAVFVKTFLFYEKIPIYAVSVLGYDIFAALLAVSFAGVVYYMTIRPYVRIEASIPVMMESGDDEEKVSGTISQP